MKKITWRNVFESQQLVQLVGFVMIVSLLWQTVRVVQKNYGLQQQVDKLNDEIAILELQNDRLRYNIEYYKTDAYLELAAREQFNKKAPGETVLVLDKDDPVDPPKPEEIQRAANKDKPQYQQNLEQWLYFLFGWEPE